MKVYLDVFHAVQRITCKIPKRHTYHKECIHALKLVFRDPTDQGKERSKHTPEPAILKSNLLEFQRQWQSVSVDGRQILPPAANKNIQLLIKHIDRGCLSAIPPGRGTNHNERLHKDLNAVLRNSRYGVEMANAMLTSTFFIHNENIQARFEQRSNRPIKAYCGISDSTPCVESFGLTTKARSDEDNIICDSDCTTLLCADGEAINLKVAGLSDIQRCIQLPNDDMQSDPGPVNECIITVHEALFILRQSCEQ